MSPWLLLAGCYDPDTFQSTEVSPDGRTLALTTARGELALLDIQRGGALRIVSRQAAGDLAWSPDSQKLAYIERPPNAPSALKLAPVAGGASSTLVRGIAWKGSPAWLGPDRVAFLSHNDDAHVGIWSVDLQTSATRPLLQQAGDISGLWASRAGDRVVFQSGDLLWSWLPASGQTVQLTPDPGASVLSNVAFSANGGAVAWCARRADRTELIWHDAVTTAVLDRLALPRPAAKLAVTRDGRIGAGQGDHVMLWRPRAGWWQAESYRVDWNAIPLQVLGPLGRHGLVYALNGNIVLAAENASRPAAGSIRARHVEDLLALAYPLARSGTFKVARDLLDGLESRVAEGSRNEFLVATAWAQLERMQGRPRSADPWLARALRAATPGSPEEEAGWLERLALAAFNAKDRPLANWILSKMPASVDDAPLVAWTRRVLEDADTGVARDWILIATAFRGGDDDAVARMTYKALDTSSPDPVALQGIKLLLGGDFEPLLGDVGEYGQRRLEALMGKPQFQIALLSILRRNLQGGPTPDEVASLLLDQWVRQGDFSSARELVRTALRESSEPLPEYLEMLRRFLVIEEADRRIQRTVTDVLLQKDIADTIAGRLSTPEERLLLRLAQVKKALIDGDPARARELLAEARKLAEQAEEADGNEPEFERAQDDFLIALFRAKIAERERRWPEAIQAYQACLELMNRVPGSWEVSPFDVAMMAELLRVGSAADPDLLRSYLEVMRGTGDPLINPTHTASTIEVGLSNLATLRRVAPDPWIQPYFTYMEGLFASLLRQSWRALDLLQRARTQNPPQALLRRIELEEGANRDTLAQHVLAARKYGQIYRADVPAPQRASAIQAAIQAEMAAGGQTNPTERLKEILQGNSLPQPWREWLALQFGSDQQHSMLPDEH